MDLFQNSVSEFDLNLFDQTTANQTTSFKQDRGARKLAIAHLKERFQGVGKIVSKADQYQELYLGEQKISNGLKQELEQIRKLLLDKNNECKVMCDEESRLVKQVAEQAEVIKKLKENLSKLEKLDYDMKLKDQVINGYSDQMKALRKILDKEVKEKKLKLKDASMELKHAKASVGMVDKKLIRVLKEYVMPTIKKRDRWLESIIKKYNLETIEEDDVEELGESNKVEKLGETDETGLYDDVLIYTPDTQPTLHRNISSDFDNIGSVDTGRGSSLGLSDEEKNLNSPDYYLGCSPHSVLTNIVCNKCNIPQTDGSTSPIFPERSDLTDNCKRCGLLSKKDACTSPIPFQSLDTATNTSDDIFETGSPRKEATSNIEQTCFGNQTDKKECESGYSEISRKGTGVSNKELFTSINKIQDFTFDSDEDDDFVSIGSGHASPVAELNKLSPINIDKVVSNSQIILIEEAPTAAVESQDDKRFDVNDSYTNLENQGYVGDSSITLQCGTEAVSTIHSKKEALSTSVKVHDETGPNIDNNVVVHDVSPITKSQMFSSIHFDDTVSTSPTMLQNKTPDLNINRSAQQQLECLELNNSNNCRNDVADDTEIRIIFDKMRLSHGLITPIPGTPSRRKIRSPKIPTESPNTINDWQNRQVNDIIKEMSRRFQESTTSIANSFITQMQGLYSERNPNKVLPNSYHSPNRRNEKFSFHENEQNYSSHHAHAESICRRRPDMVDLNMGSMLCITEVNENEDSTYNDSIVIDDQITSTETNNVPDNLVCASYKENDDEMSNASLLEVDQSHVFGRLNCKVAAENSFNGNNTGDTARDVTHSLFENNVECDNNTQVSVVNSNTASSLSSIESRKSIVFESIDISDNDDDEDVPISELFNLTPNNNETPRKRNGKSKKKSKLDELRTKMLPKSKIKKDDVKSIRTLKSKLIHTTTVPKKKVTISDTAATLNDKAVYENAVEVFTRSRSAKVPKIILEDCVGNSQDLSKNIAKNKDDNSSKPQSPEPQSSMVQSHVVKKNNKRKLSESLPHVPEKYTDSDKSANISETTKDKRTGTVMDENFNDKSPKNIKQRENDILHQNRSFKTPDADILSPKHSQGAVQTSGCRDTKMPKRKRSSVSDYQTQNLNAKSNVNIEPHSSRVLRSLTLAKNKKACVFQETPIVQTRQRLRSKDDKNEPETCCDTLLPKKISRITRQKSHSGSENTHDDLFSSPRSKQDQNEPETCVDTYNMSSKPKTRIARVKTHSGTENTHDDLNSFPRSKTDQNESETCGDTSLPKRISTILKQKSHSGSENTHVDLFSSPRSKQDQNEPETCVDTYNMSSKPKTRIARVKIHSGSENKHGDLNSSPQSRRDQNEPETSVDTSLPKRISRITRQKSHSGSENTHVDLFSSPQSKQDQNEPETCVDTYNISSKPKNRIATVKTHSGSEKPQVVLHSPPLSDTSIKNSDQKTSAVSYADLNMFSNVDDQQQINTSDQYSKYSLLCQTIQKYGVKRIKFIAKQAKEPKVNEVWRKLENSISEILEVPHELCLSAMKKLVAEIQTWNKKHFILGFIKYLKDPERKRELFGKLICQPFPPMTKQEQVLLFVFDELQKSYEYRDIVKKILMNIEYTLLALNKAAESFDVIETMSHFYAILCRGYQKISQLRMFIIDAMYCLQHKSVNLVQQCLDVWMNVLPMGHTGLAKCPLVACLVYLLHFYKCEDRYNKVQNIRNTLRYKYNYDLTDWNENMILDMFRTAIVEIRDSVMERKSLRLSLLILAKRHGAKWCHTNIVKNMLQPIISDNSTTERAKQFCLAILGPLLKPYPGNMKVHYEMVIDYLMEKLERKNTPKIQEAIVSSLIYVDKRNQRLHQFLAKWSPKQVSSDFALVFRDYVRSKPVHVWKKILSWKI